MPLLHINSGRHGPVLHASASRLDTTLARALGGCGPIIVMLHGYKFTPGHPVACPHRHILSLAPGRNCRKALSWPRELGLGRGTPDEGLGIAFGWPARGTIWQAYRQAGEAGSHLATLIRQIRRHAPRRPVHLIAHSLGARVALRALAQLPEGSIGRMILLAGAEFGTHARAALDSPAGHCAQLINVTSRENDLFDFLLERLIAPPAPGDGCLAQHMPRRANTLTLQLDHVATPVSLAAAGFALAPPTARICHWSSYLRPGVFALYRALLHPAGADPLPRLRAALPDTVDPRWSRLLPPFPDLRLRPPPRGRATP